VTLAVLVIVVVFAEILDRILADTRTWIVKVMLAPFAIVAMLQVTVPALNEHGMELLR
jgi:hypothetical protein